MLKFWEVRGSDLDTDSDLRHLGDAIGSTKSFSRYSDGDLSLGDAVDRDC